MVDQPVFTLFIIHTDHFHNVCGNSLHAGSVALDSSLDSTYVMYSLEQHTRHESMCKA